MLHNYDYIELAAVDYDGYIEASIYINGKKWKSKNSDDSAGPICLQVRGFDFVKNIEKNKSKRNIDNNADTYIWKGIVILTIIFILLIFFNCYN